MPDVSLTDDQFERLSQLRGKLASETQAGPYASVNLSDTIEYLLDLSETTDGETLLNSAPTPDGPDSNTHAVASGVDPAPEQSETDTSGGADMFNLLETHADKWRESDGQERYEVDLPDGGVKTARTRDDVKAVLFQNYR
jgi:hypothetical protein